jgi:hypothetical protein
LQVMTDNKSCRSWNPSHLANGRQSRHNGCVAWMFHQKAW